MTSIFHCSSSQSGECFLISCKVDQLIWVSFGTTSGHDSNQNNEEVRQASSCPEWLINLTHKQNEKSLSLREEDNHLWISCLPFRRMSSQILSIDTYSCTQECISPALYNLVITVVATAACFAVHIRGSLVDVVQISHVHSCTLSFDTAKQMTTQMLCDHHSVDATLSSFYCYSLYLEVIVFF